jgi:hypothetical protein
MEELGDANGGPGFGYRRVNNLPIKLAVSATHVNVKLFGYAHA